MLNGLSEKFFDAQYGEELRMDLSLHNRIGVRVSTEHLSDELRRFEPFNGIAGRFHGWSPRII